MFVKTSVYFDVTGSVKRPQELALFLSALIESILLGGEIPNQFKIGRADAKKFNLDTGLTLEIISKDRVIDSLR